MPLRRVLIDVPLSSGLSQKSDVRSIAQSGAVQMTNCVRQKSGAITKRYGNYALSNVIQAAGGATIGAAVRGQQFNRIPLLIDGTSLFLRSDEGDGTGSLTTAGTWLLVDEVPEAVALDRIPVPSPGVQAAIGTTGSFLAYGVAAGAGYIAGIICSKNSGNAVSATIFDGVSNAPLFTNTLWASDTGSTSANSARIIIAGTTALAMWTVGTLGGSSYTLQCATLDLTTIGTTGVSWTQFTFATGVTSPAFDLEPVVGDSTRFAAGYNSPFGGGHMVLTVAPVTNPLVSSGVSYVQDTTPANGSVQSVSVRSTNGLWHRIVYAYTTGAGAYTFAAWCVADSIGATPTATIPLSTATSVLGIPTTGLEEYGAAVTNLARAFWSFGINGGVGTTSLYAIYSIFIEGVGGTYGNQSNTFGPLLLSQPRTITTEAGSRVYAMVLTPSSIQGTPQLVCFDWFFSLSNDPNWAARLVATVSPRLMRVGPVTGFTASSFVQNTAIGGSVWIAGIITQTVAGQSTATMAIQPFDFASALLGFGEQVGPCELGMSSGAPFTTDGSRVSEMGFPTFPENISANASTTGGSMTTGAPADVYSYTITWEWVDAQGQIHRSGTSVPLTVDFSASSAGTTGSVTLTLPTISTSWRQRGYSVLPWGNISPPAAPAIRIVVYRTKAGGTTYYRAYSDPNTILNGLTAGQLTYVDGATDAAIGANELLYTTGGTLDNLCPPSARICIQHTTRWFLAGCDDPTQIWASKAYVTGEVPGFNEAFVTVASGRVTALVSLDDKLIIFVVRGSSPGLEYMTGLGPNDAGANSDWTQPQPIPCDVGAVDQRSICVGPFGCIFKSNVGGPTGSGGIFLLTRDLQVEYLSGPVEDTLALHSEVTSVVLHPFAGRVYFTIRASSRGSTVRLVWDYIQQCWSTDLPYDFENASFTPNVPVGWVANGRVSVPGVGITSGSVPLYHWANGAGRVYRETMGQGGFAFIDSFLYSASPATTRQWIPSTYQTGWIKPSMSGFARFWRVQLQADSLDPAQITMQLTFDYAPSSYYAESASWTDAQIALFDRAPQLDVQMVPGNQKAKSIQVTLTDAAPIGSFATGQGANWATISFELGVGDRAYPNLPAGQKA